MSRTIWFDDAAHEETGQRTIWLLSGGALEEAGGGSASEGAIAVTLGSLTSAATGALAIVGSLTPVTLAPATLSAAGTGAIIGTLSQTLATLTLAGFGGEKSGVLAGTLDALLLAGHGGVAAGLVSATLGALTSTAAGTVSKTGFFTRTLRDVGLTGTGALPITGSLAATL